MKNYCQLHFNKAFENYNYVDAHTKNWSVSVQITIHYFGYAAKDLLRVDIRRKKENKTCIAAYVVYILTTVI